ncbi:P-loop containing nucleoside triphosphate hydrolase protein [Usnea florida]
MNVVKNKMGHEAPIVGVISNSFDDISSFVGLEEDNVALEPIFNDVLGDRARSTVRNVKTAVDDFEAELNQFFSNPKYPPKIPAVQLFGMEECNQEVNKLANQIELPQSLKDVLNASQFRAVQTILNRKISVTWGAPGTGKSQVLSQAMLWLLENTDECMVATAVANVAVDALLGKVVGGYRSLHPQAEIPIARVYSQAQITAQYATGDLDLIDEDYHLEALRVKHARMHARFTGFLEAVDQLRNFGSIKDEVVHDAYMEEGRELTRMVLEDNVRIVFCTVTGCQSAALYKVHGADNELEWAYPAKSAFLDEAGTMTRPMMEMPVMAFVKTLQRLSIAGDPFQLPAFILSPFAKAEWAGSWLKKIVDQKWPVTFLDTQYRMYDMLYDHLIATIYAGELQRLRLDTIHSVKSIADPTAFGRQLNSAMPIRFESGHQSYALDSIESFINVPNGVQRSLEAGSSWNTQEIDVIDGAILKLVSIGFRQEDIAVITGYSEQKRLLTIRAKENGWSGVKQIMTIDSSQGDEYKIIFVSLVTTRNQAGFMGTRYRACVGTSRQIEALYFVGNADYWFTRIEGGFKYMHNILKHIRGNRLAWNQPPFIVGPPAQTAIPAPPTHAAKGKGKEVDTPVASDPVTVPASEKLKTFIQKADERRAAAKAAAAEELAAIERKYIESKAKLEQEISNQKANLEQEISDEKAKSEQEQSETQRLLEEDIAAELEALRFEAQMEGS